MVMDFESFRRPTKPNNYILCDLTSGEPADGPSPVFTVSEKSLKEALIYALEGEPRLEFVNIDQDLSCWKIVQRSRVFRFADDISIKFIPVENQKNTVKLAIYSASRVGYSDLGVNKARVSRWLTLLSHSVDVNKK